MPSFDIVKEITAGRSFKIEQVKSGFDLQTNHIREQFTGNIDIEGKEWNVGLIVGRSGTGKTTIAREAFKESYPPPHEYGQNAIIDEMPEGKSYKEITQTFTSVGFSSPPSWLKPYHVLSNGERMRVDLAYAILSDADPILFDEFTSVVDRDIAKICSFAISKSVRKLKKKFIAVSCHDDIIDWLEPDWVYDTNSQTFTFRGYQKTRPDINIEVREIPTERKRSMWNLFRKYHYLDTDLHIAARCFVGYLKGVPVSFCAIIHQMHAVSKNLKRVHRLVVLPDYQGVGIGMKFLEFIGDIYRGERWDLRLVSSQVNVMKSLTNHGWIMKNCGRASGGPMGLYWLQNTVSARRITGSFQYIGGG